MQESSMMKINGALNLKNYQEKFKFFTVFNIFSLELILILYMNVGRYKAASLFSGFPVDLTKLLFVILIITSIIMLFTDKAIKFTRAGLIYSALFALFASYITFTLIWTPSEHYALEKIIRLWVEVGVPSFLIALIIVNSPERINRFINFIIMFAIIYSGSSIIYKLYTHAYVVNIFGGVYQGIGDIVNFGAVAVLAKIYYSENKTQKILWQLLYASFFISLSFIGNKAAFLSQCVLLLAFSLHWLFFKNKLSYAMLIFSSVSIFIGISIYFLISLYPSLLVHFAAINRLVASGITGDTARIGYIQATLNLDYQYLWFIGHGVGSWPILTGAGDVRHYPHNIVLELLTEVGVLGLVLYLLVVFTMLINLARNYKTYPNFIYLFSFLLFCITGFTSIVSGEVSSMFWLFTSLALMSAQKLRIDRQNYA